MEEILIVDGYNIIGALHDLGQLNPNDLEDARDELIDQLAEYQAIKGVKVYVIFDAHRVPGLGRKMEKGKVEIIYTGKDETADERIEKLVKQLARVQRQIYVATSDYMEQRMVLGKGALRKSARELLIEFEQMEKHIETAVREKYTSPSKRRIPLQSGMAEILEKLRRGQ